MIIFGMIDNLIFYPRKKNWINLELYFESYEFSNSITDGSHCF